MPAAGATRELAAQIDRGVKTLQDILGAPVECSAAAGWRADERVVEAKEAFGFRYNSDCRGRSLFRPRLADGRLGTPQIPVDLPTYDEVVGRGLRAGAFTDFILDRFRPGGAQRVHRARRSRGHRHGRRISPPAAARRRGRGIRFKPLGSLLPATLDRLPAGLLRRGELPGREGWLGVQA